MINKKENRLRRAGATRARIKLQKVNRLTVHRTNLHIYATIIAPEGDRVLVSASTLEAEVRAKLAADGKTGGNIAAAKIVGARLAEKAKAAGIESCAFDRSGYRYHGRVAALAEAARKVEAVGGSVKLASSSNRNRGLWLRLIRRTPPKKLMTAFARR